MHATRTRPLWLGVREQVSEGLEEARNAKQNRERPPPVWESAGEGCSGGSGVFRAGPVIGDSAAVYVHTFLRLRSYKGSGSNGVVAIQVSKRRGRSVALLELSIHVGRGRGYPGCERAARSEANRTK